MDCVVTKKDTLLAEVMWCMKVITSHFSYNSCRDVNTLFRIMFPDSKIAKNFTCGADKCKYLSVYGLAPYFKRLLVKSVNCTANFVLMFDESLNYENQSKQMDIYVRFWDNDKVTSRYYGSEFMGHGEAERMLHHFNTCVNDLSLNKLVQISMDGPSVNWKFHRNLQQQISNDCDNKLLEIGSCGLHVLHGAFKTGFEKSDYMCTIQKLLTSMYYLFKDSPARKEDFIAITESDVFPMKFCNHRWLENLPVAQRALLVWDNVKKYVKAATTKKVAEPTSKSYSVVKEAASNPRITAMIQFYISVIRELQPFLLRYQCDKPMIPFIGEDLFKIMRALMLRFVKSDIMVNVTTLSRLMKVDVVNKDNQALAKKVVIGAACEETLQGLVTKKKMSERDELAFRSDCKKVLITLVTKLLDKSPLKYNLVSCAVCLDPRKMSTDRDDCCCHMKKMVKLLADNGKISLDESDVVNAQFADFLDMEVSKHRAEFMNFKPYDESDSGRVDMLLFRELNNRPEYMQLWRIIKMVLLISHGQASVERGFSVNKQVAVENLKEGSFVAQRMICDHVRNVGGVLSVNYSKDLIMAAAGAKQKYLSYLDDLKRQTTAKEKNTKRKRIEDEIGEVKAKKRLLQTDIDSMTTSADKLAEKAEVTGKTTFISQSNSLRRSAKQKKSELDSTDDKLNELLKSLKDS